MKKIALFTLLLISGCGDKDFSPTYSESVCVPAQDLYFLDLPAAESNSSGSCCADSGLVSCCFGGRFVCVDGKTGIGCGCPTN